MLTNILSPEALRILSAPEVTGVLVGLSGGADSVALLHALANSELGVPLKAIHVNHGLHDAADKMEQVCRDVCDTLDVPLVVTQVEVSRKGSLEANARHARYQAYLAAMFAGEMLALAHHADDQVETALLQLFRGSRVQGWQGMPAQRRFGPGRLYRPLLSIRRDQVRGYAEHCGLQWMEDPTNEDTSHDRNWLRHVLIPELTGRWPEVTSVILDALARDESTRALQSQDAAVALQDMRVAPDALDLNAIQDAEPELRRNVIDAWMQELELPLPSLGVLDELPGFLAASGGLLGYADLEFRKHCGRLHVLRALPPVTEPPVFSGAGSIEVPGGTLIVRHVTGAGVAPRSDYQLAYRTGGERIRIGHSRTLKNIFQESHTPEWLRDRIPLLLAGDTIAAIAAVPDWGLPMRIADSFAAPPSEPGLELALQLNDRVP